MAQDSGMENGGGASGDAPQCIPPCGFHCVFCGYDLGGHTGDDRRCPECGRHTTTQLLWEAWRIGRQRIKAFQGPIIPSLLFIPVALLGWPFLIKTASPAPTWIKTALAVFILVWAVGVWLYLRRYRRHIDRFRFLLESHVVVVAIGLGGPATLVSVFMLVMKTYYVVALPLLCVCLAMGALAVWAYRDMKRRLPVYRLSRLRGAHAASWKQTAQTVTHPESSDRSG